MNKNEKYLNIKEIIGDSKAILEEQGSIINKNLKDLIENYDEIVLDFQDIDLVSTPFIYKLFDGLINPDYIFKISYKHLKKEYAELVYLILRNSLKIGIS